MNTRHALLLAGTVAAFLLAPGPSALGGDGFVARRPLRAVPAAGQPALEGGVEAWLRVTHGKRILQGFTVWFRGLQDGAGNPLAGSDAVLWMAKPGQADLEEVASFAVADNGSGVYQVRLDSSHKVNPELPLSVTRVLDLLRAPVEVRLASTGGDDVTVLRGSIGTFRFQDVDENGTGERVRSRRSALRLPPAPAANPDTDAGGSVRVYRRRGRGGADPVFQGVSLFASGLTEDETYDVLVEDDAGELQEAGSVVTTADGMGFFSLDTRAGDDVADLGVDDVRELFGRRVELRLSGSEDSSLVGLLPRIR